uniref:adenylate cyclase n=1 Tax=Glossina austeni TaxID=7395 RepID=A0A1A9UI69_GLOAU
MDYSGEDMQERYDLKEQIMDMNLESVYQSYIRKIKRNYLGTFTIAHLVIAVVQSLEMYDVYFYIFGAILTCLCIRPFMSEKFTKSHRYVPFIVSWIAGFTMALTDNIVPAQIAKTLTREIEERMEETFEGLSGQLGKAIKQLDIDMRIGIHSGSLLGGIIGASKWQYDVWSVDVDIANRLEATGMPGRLHVSNSTLHLAQDFYVYENGTEKATLDPVLIKNNVRTFLIIDKSRSRHIYVLADKCVYDWLEYWDSSSTNND